MEWIMIKVRVGQETFCKWGCGSLHSPVGMRLQAADSTQGRATFTLGKDKCSFSGSSRAARTRGPQGSGVSLPLASSPLSPPALLEGTGLHSRLPVLGPAGGDIDLKEQDCSRAEEGPVLRTQTFWLSPLRSLAQTLEEDASLPDLTDYHLLEAVISVFVPEL